MEQKFYTTDQIAEILGMHHRTIRKFITEGKLRANKVGKQWRISGHDLSTFIEGNNVCVNNKNEGIEFSTNNIDTIKNNKINVSTVVDINDINSDEYKNISNMLLALINSKDNNMKNSTMNIKYYKDENNLKIMLWGSINFIKEMLDFIETLTTDKNVR